MLVIHETKEGRFKKRLNRFEALVELEGSEVLVHVPNTGRCKELLLHEARVVLEKRPGAHRKTAYELIMVYKGDNLISIDSQAPNKIVEEAVREGMLTFLNRYQNVRREVTYGGSRFDFFLHGESPEAEQSCFIEVKGVTLEREGVAMFPDAPTERGAKHIFELIRAKEQGYEAGVIFVIQMQGTHCFVPNDETDPAFSNALRQASKAGVFVKAYDCTVTEQQLTLSREVPIKNVF